MSLRSFVALGSILSALGCSSSSEPALPREIGVILPGLSGVAIIESPDTVSVNRPFSIVINTFGSQCTTPTGVSLRLEPSRAHITPFDLVTEDTQPCPRDYGPRPHPVEIVLRQTGAAEIVVRGISVGGTIPGRSLTIVRKAIWVRETS